MRSKAKSDLTWWKSPWEKIIKERGLQIVSRPEVEANELSEGGAFSFSAVFEVKPEIEVKDYLGVEVEKVKSPSPMLKSRRRLRRLQEGHARLELVEGRDIVQKGDFRDTRLRGLDCRQAVFWRQG